MERGLNGRVALHEIEPIDLPGALAPEYVRAHKLLPLELTERAVTVVAPYEPDPDLTDDLRVAFSVPQVNWLRASEREVDAAIDRALLHKAETVTDLVRDLAVAGSDGIAAEASAEDLSSLANQPPVVKLVNLILLEALDGRASDVHLEAHEAGLNVRYRIDGVLLDAACPPAYLRDALVSRVKVMAGLDIAERRAPQDGRVRLRLKDRRIDVRVSTLPGIHGESVVLRLLDAETQRLSLEELGMGRDMLAAFDRLIRRPHGIVLVSGPTGSGKTTSLYAALSRIKTGREKIVTVEDPVEYRITGVTQVQVNRAAGVTFATALRSILRQDPDIILVGEMRDPETAEIAVHAALTGHLVFSTVHTNDAATGITRLLDLGVPDYLVASAVQGIVAQRLVRRICVSCREETEWPFELTRRPRESTRAWRGRGCEACRRTGYHGRVGIFELLLMDDALRREVLSHRGSEAIRKIAVGKGMRTIREDGLAKCAEGLTTIEEVARATEEA
jgi:general secretion pathway protein E